MEGSEVTLTLEKTSIADMEIGMSVMPDNLWDERESIAKRVIDNFVPTMPWRDRLEFAQRLQQYRECGCDEHMAVLCAVIMLSSERAYGFNIQEWTQ